VDNGLPGAAATPIVSALYGFELVFPRRSLRAALTALADRADPDGFSGCTVELPDEPELWVPFDGVCEHGPLDRWSAQPPGEAWLRGALWFGVDAAVRTYLEHTSVVALRTTAGGEQATIGEVSVFLLVGARWEILSVGAVTTWMSRLFERSASVQRAMVEVLHAAGGRGAVLTRESGDPADDLLRPGRSRVLPPLVFEDPASIDAFADAVCA
jgi:hypothetical protein